jgi:hypothetical protein
MRPTEVCPRHLTGQTAGIARRVGDLFGGLGRDPVREDVRARRDVDVAVDDGRVAVEP